MPFETVGNQIRVRVKSPSAFQEGSFRTITIDKGRGISAIIGKLKGQTSTTVQSYRFDAEKWTESSADRWVKDHEKRSERTPQTRANVRMVMAKGGNTWRLVVMRSGFSEDGNFFFPDEMLKASATVFEKKPVNIFEFVGRHFNHLPNQVADALPKGVAHNVVGWIDSVRFEDLTEYGLDGKGLTADFHITDPRLAASMKSAWDQGRPDLYGFSVDARADRISGIVDGRATQVVTSITRAGSLDIVSEPNAGGQLLRLVASFNRKEGNMNIWKKIVKNLLAKFDTEDLAKAVRSNPKLAGVSDVEALKEKDDAAVVAAMTDHLSGQALKAHPEVASDRVTIPANVLEQIGEMAKSSEAIEFVSGALKGDSLIVAQAASGDDDDAADDSADADTDADADDKSVDEPKKDAEPKKDDAAAPKVDAKVAAELKQTRKMVEQLQRENAERMIADRLTQSKLPASAQKEIRDQLSGRLVTSKEVDRLIRSTKTMIAAMADDGDIIPLASSGIEVGRNETDKLQLALDKTLGGMDDSRKSDYQGIDAFTGIKDSYITMTGDKKITGEGTSRLQMSNLSDWTNALANTLHRRITKAYSYHYNVWRPLVNIVPYTDFRENQAIRIGAFDDLNTVLDDGEYTAIATPSEEKIAWTGYTKGNTFYVTRKMIINDDTRLVMRLSEQMGNAAGRTVAKGVFDLILSYTAAINDRVIYDGKVLYHADHGANFDDYALNSDNLTLARARMMAQTDLDSGEELGIIPAFLIVPAGLLDTALKLCNSERTKGDTDDVDINVHKGRLTPVYSPYLRGDANNWYLTANPQQIDMIDIGFFNGQDTPELLVQDQPTNGAVFTHDRITYKVRIEPGGAIIDWRGFFASLKS